MTKIYVKQLRSNARSTDAHVKTLKALGLGRVGKANLLADSKAVRGMIRHVLHWVEVKHV